MGHLGTIDYKDEGYHYQVVKLLKLSVLWIVFFRDR